MANKRDYYGILGVSKSASDTDIKSAYRKLARAHHPDIDKSAGAAERFKEISEAYQVLSDAQKRKAYDQFGHAAFDRSQGFGGAGAGASPFGAGFNPFGGVQGGPFGQGGFSYSWSTSGGQGSEAFVDPFDLFEQIFGMSGLGADFSRGFRRRQTYQMDLSFDEAVHGVAKQVEVPRVEGSHNKIVREKMTIKIPAGVDEGTRMRFGDVDIVFRVKPHHEFVREGADIFSEVYLSVPQVVLGDIIEVKTVYGKVKLKVPPGTQPGSLVKIKGKGVTTMRGAVGDHFIRVRVEIPKAVSASEKKLYEQLAQLRDKKKGWF